MSETSVDLGVVTAPSGVLVLGMAGSIDQWPEVGDPLSMRALAAAGFGGGHLHEPADGPGREWWCEAVAVPAAADRPLEVRAEPWVSPDGPVISVLEVDLGLPWPDDGGGEPIRLGDLPVDRCGMVLGDARAVDSFVGLNGESVDGLADVTYWGKYEDEAHAVFGGERTPRYGGQGPYGRLDLPLREAHEYAGQLRNWLSEGPRNGLMVSVDAHNHFHLLDRAGQTHPLLAGQIEIDGCQVLGLGWDPGDHSMRHRGERAWGQVYPVTLERRDTTTLLRWAIPAEAEEPEQTES
ncbi:hypothetical protein GCM10009760_63720 [Kitasatospora kazusensis]|uniref:Uncharacterized protein n=1 Tax=Kitasatospora kazusensis TaxID=407974 RepID=A0ABP4KHN6_9ACTN